MLSQKPHTHPDSPEAALRRSDERFRAFVAASSDVVYQMSPDWKEMRRLVGRGFVADTDNPSKDWLEKYIPLEDRPCVLAAIDKAVRTKSIFELEHKVVREDGSLGWTFSRAVPLLDECGGIVEWIGAAKNITERKEAEQMLQNEARQAFLLKLSDAMRSLTDPGLIQATAARLLGEHLGANRAAYFEVEGGNYVVERDYTDCVPSLVGRHPVGSFNSRSHAEYCAGRIVIMRDTEADPDLSPEEKAVFASIQTRAYVSVPLIKSGVFVAGLAVHSAAPRNWTPMEVSVIEDTAQRTWSAVARARTEKALQHLNETLETQVSERTKLAEARTRQLQALTIELIESEEKERRRFARLLHDDLQQMLAAAKLQLQNLKGGPERDGVLKKVEWLLEESIAKSRRLSHELSPEVLQNYGLAAALQWIGRQMDEQFGLKVEFESSTKQELENPTLKIFVFRAVRELLFNIVKHADTNEARVALSGDKDRVTITVSDRGKGFDSTILDHAHDNAGFGLLTIKERAQYIGGNLTVESGRGRGSRFTLTIPVNAKTGATATDVTTAGAMEVTPETVYGAETPDMIRVLFADDHRIMRRGLIEMIAGKPNVEVVGEACDGRDAIEKTRELQPDVIVMDVSMPDMDGIHATRRIKTEWPWVRVIGLSMHEDGHIARRMRRAGAEAFVCKMASPAELLKAIYG